MLRKGRISRNAYVILLIYNTWKINVFMFLCFFSRNMKYGLFSLTRQPFVACLWSPYKITFQSCLYLVWLRRYDKKLILAAILNFFFKMLKDENSTPLDVIIYMLEMNNQQRKNYIRQKGVMSKNALWLPDYNYGLQVTPR